jgi:hypothetical protein
LQADKPSAHGYYYPENLSGSTVHLSVVKGKRLALRYFVVVKLPLDCRLGHLAVRLAIFAVVVELVLGLVEERSDEVKDAVYHVRPRTPSVEASK